jgi:hypothetical protein
MPLILGANSVTGGYEIDNSLRFNSGSSDSLTKTTTTPDNRDKLTLSAWFKISSSSTSQEIFGFYGSNDYFTVRASNSNSIDVILYDGSTIGRLITTQLLRDFSAWYHIVVVVDSANATADDRMKIYLNGNQITSFSTRTNPSQNQDFILSTLTTTGIGINTDQVGGVSRFNGYISEAFYIDNQALDPTDFGEFDSDTGIWKPIAYTGTYGTAGFYLEFKDSSALGDDTSGEGNDFTVNNLTSIDQTTDTPTNNFATANPLHFNVTIPSSGTLSDGNLTFTSSQGASAYPAFYSTIGASQGKWYAEFKVTTANSAMIGIGSGIATGGYLGGGLYDYAYYYDGSFINNGSNQGTQSSYTDGDIISVAMDLDNNKIYVAKDNVWQHSGDPSAGTGGFAITAPASNNTGTYLIAYGDAGGGTPAIQGNFGNPPFAITTGNEDANGYGNFEYAVPPGYYALCTKNLAEYG